MQQYGEQYQQYGDFGWYAEDRQPPRPRRERDRGRRRAIGSTEGSPVSTSGGAAGARRLRREIRQALGSPAARRRAVLLGEILGPPKSLQAATVGAAEGEVSGQQPSVSGRGTPQNGRQHYAETSPPNQNGHAELAADQSSGDGQPAATAQPSTAAGAASGRAELPSEASAEVTSPARAPSVPQRQGPFSAILAVSFRAARGWLRRAGITP